MPEEEIQIDYSCEEISDDSSRNNEPEDKDSTNPNGASLDFSGRFLAIEQVPIGEIFEHGELSIRDHYDQKIIDVLENKIRYKRIGLPMIVLFLIGKIYYIADGVYRYLAHKRAKQTHIWAEVREGTLRDALLYRFQANADIGKALTPFERRRIAKMMFEDDEWKSWSLNFIANFCGLSVGTLKVVWKEMYPSLEYSKMRTAIRNGKIYQVDTTNIGKHKKNVQTSAESLPVEGKWNGENSPPSTEEVDKALEQLELCDRDDILPAPYSQYADVKVPEAQAPTDAAKPTKAELAEQAQLRQNVQPGEVFLFESIQNPGQHHVLACLDSTDIRMYAILFLYHMVGLFLTDFPYNCDFESKLAKGQIRNELDKIANDKLTSHEYRSMLRKVLQNSRKILLDGSAWVAFYGIQETSSTFLLLKRHFGPIRKLIVWVKDGLKQNWSREFRDGQECAYFGYIGDSIRWWNGTKSQTTAFEERLFDKSGNGEPRNGHPCPKPLPIIAAIIELMLEPGGRVYDPMAGRGTTLISAERTARLATVTEINPTFCALAKELAESTGMKCVRTTLEDFPRVLAELEGRDEKVPISD